MPEHTIEADNLHLWRGERHVLRGVSFRLTRGSCLEVYGANGAGKTTLLRLLCGLIYPEEGRVLWNGENVRRDLSAFHSSLAYLGHEPPLKADLTARENLRYWIGVRRPLGQDELEGALTRVVAFASLTGRSMDVELAQDVLRDVFPQGEAAVVSIVRIQELVCDRFGVTLVELKSERRSQSIVYPRQVAMYLSRELTDSSLPKIGKHFGGRDHTTVIHATSKIARMIKEDRSVYNLVQELTARVKQVR